jgi:hypothetical protein
MEEQAAGLSFEMIWLRGYFFEMLGSARLDHFN